MITCLASAAAILSVPLDPVVNEQDAELLKGLGPLGAHLGAELLQAAWADP